jgi:hypothetical protein
MIDTDEIFRELAEAVNELDGDLSIPLFRQFIQVAEFPFKSHYADGYSVIKINGNELLVFRYIDYEEPALEIWADKAGFFLYKTDMESFIEMYFESHPFLMGHIYGEGRLTERMEQVLPRNR